LHKLSMSDTAHKDHTWDLVAVALCAISAAAGFTSIAAGWLHAPRAIGLTGVAWTLIGNWLRRSFGRWQKSPSELYQEARVGPRRSSLSRNILLGSVLFYAAAVLMLFL
jgi:hypothetical protein